jgi:thiol-disulfide isomerase/thioredoxin
MFAPLAEAAQPFDAKAFQDAQAASKPIVLHVTAPWCPTCRQQHPVVQALEKERPNLVVYEIDFDSKKELLKRFGVRTQSTLIVFKGGTETARAAGVTDPAQIRDLVGKAF